MGQGGGLSGWPTLLVCWVQGTCSVPCFCSPHPDFAPGSSKLTVGFLVSLYLWSRICPKCACTQFLVVPYGFSVFCCWRRGVSGCRPGSTAVQASGSQPASLGALCLQLHHSSLRLHHHRAFSPCIFSSLVRASVSPVLDHEHLMSGSLSYSFL